MNPSVSLAKAPGEVPANSGVRAIGAPEPEQRRRRPSRDPKAAARETFLTALRSGWTVKHAAQLAGVAPQRFYEARQDDESFADAWADAIEAGTQVLEDELHRRAVEGWDEDSYDGNGRLVRRVRRYSPALLIFSLKARRPEVYRDVVQRLELTGVNGGPVELQAGFEPTTLADVVALARQYGVLDSIDGEAVEVAELEEGPS